MNLEQKIQGFEKMTQADPENELGHFSLGQAYQEAKDFSRAAKAFQRVIQLKPNFSKAYQCLAETQKAAGQIAEAIATLKQGYVIAFQVGQFMPRNEMGKLLKELGQEIPTVEQAVVATPQAPFIGEAVVCVRCRQRAPKLATPPLPGELGKKVFENICQNCWKEWLAMGVKVINELQLDFTKPGSANVYDNHMKEFLNLQEAPPSSGFSILNLPGQR